MERRWKMNRIGFVNFWLYDEEEFEFLDGRLLLRGQNGSGKSITTQSFIPFILDGDRTPNRLDPFGSNDRRMEYYFLGEEGKEEATGYLFLEFKMQDAEEYRTIGIGQRAKRGKSMDFWGFILLDGRRIGYDLWLYKELGSTKLPYDKRELREVLGEENLLTDSQSEYKKLVNQYIFGFRKAEQYEQFIKLLVKVRAPKLSKEFKPTKVYDILNESLQTLSDEELRTMVEAMEKMDEIQDSLEMLNRAYADVNIIRKEYIRYNQYVLAKKAASYLKKEGETETAQQKFEAELAEKVKLEEELETISQSLAELSDREKLAQTEREGLMDTDIRGIHDRLYRMREEKSEAEKKVDSLKQKIEEYKEKIYLKEGELKRCEEMLEEYQQSLAQRKQELREEQEILQWEEHENVLRFLGLEQSEGAEEFSKKIVSYKSRLEECRKEIHAYEEIRRRYDESAETLERVSREKAEGEQALREAERQMSESRDRWVVQLYDHAKNAECWKPDQSVLQKAEEQVQSYQDAADAEKVQEVLRSDYEGQRLVRLDEKQLAEHQISSYKEKCDALKQELEEVSGKAEIEPCRSEAVLQTREGLRKADIEAVPFYAAVEFADGLAEEECARLEAQLEGMGILDALVVSEKDFSKVAESCPEFTDTVLYVPKEGTSKFSKLTVSAEINPDIKTSVQRILSNLYESHAEGNGIYLGEDGRFLQGLLAGRARKAEAEFLGRLTRQKKKEQKIARLQGELAAAERELLQQQTRSEELAAGIEKLEQEYRRLPMFREINLSVEQQRRCSSALERIMEDYRKAELQERKCAAEKQGQYQIMLQKCKPLPYGRTEAEYEEATDALESYQVVWSEAKELLLKLGHERALHSTAKETLEQNEQILDDVFADKRVYTTKIKEYDIQISQCEEYLSSPEIAEKTQRIEQLDEEIEEVRKKIKNLGDQSLLMANRHEGLVNSEQQKRACLQELIAEETCLRNLFEEELSLKLIMERGTRTLPECAREAVTLLREGDKNREYGEVFQALNEVYQKHCGSLANYGTSLENCFDTQEVYAGVSEDFLPFRRRMRVVSAWNGKKVYLEEFYQILKTAIEETELLIKQKDRELFEDILSQTISQQLTDRIAESRNWVKDMSVLMKELDTSMGLSFSLEWKPRSAESEQELDTAELEEILLRDRDLLRVEDIEKVAEHFRSKIRMGKRQLEEADCPINYMELVRDALDYRKWFEFRMFYRQGTENRKPLTNAAFNRFSGGEKAMAMYVPLFAAVNAQYKKADYGQHPRILALDEAFAGVDDKNISSMFELVHKMDFDYIMNSQSLWGCYETVKGIRISELHRPMNSQVVTVIRYIWNGHERVLDVQ